MKISLDEYRRNKKRTLQDIEKCKRIVVEPIRKDYNKHSLFCTCLQCTK